MTAGESRKSGTRGGLSADPTKRAAQLANLRRGVTAAPAGNQRRLTHGGYAAIAAAELETKTKAIFDAVAQDVPVKAADGGLPAYDTILVRVLAETLIRRDRVLAEEVAHGIEIASGPRKGELRGIAQYGLRLDGQVIDLLDRLGMSPTARAKLGLQLAQTVRTLEDQVAAAGDLWQEPAPGDATVEATVVDAQGLPQSATGSATNETEAV